MFQFSYKRLQRITTSEFYLPEIDGIRFLAIVLVILFHIQGYFLVKSGGKFTDNPHDYSLINALFIGGNRGVELFFCLSGFILCLPFAQCFLKNKKEVSLKKYYLRRLIRLEPPYFIAMMLLFLAAVVMKVYTFSFLFPSLLASLIYAHNIIFNHTPFVTVVAWSLEIEIQFYLIAPLLFKVLKLPVALRRSLLITAILGFVCLQTLLPIGIDCIYNYFQYFLAGILLADLFVSGVGINILKKNWVKYFGCLTLIAIIFLPFRTFFYAKLMMPFLIIMFYLLVMRNETIKRGFSYKFIPIIGGMCYSIYLLHYAIISIFGRLTMQVKVSSYYLPNLLLQIALLSIPIVLISTGYYYFIERPFMSNKWMHKILKLERV